jgi:hypothetical protein
MTMSLSNFSKSTFSTFKKGGAKSTVGKSTFRKGGAKIEPKPHLEMSVSEKLKRKRHENT